MNHRAAALPADMDTADLPAVALVLVAALALLLAGAALAFDAAFALLLAALAGAFAVVAFLAGAADLVAARASRRAARL